MSRAVMQQALEALEKCSDWPGAYDACSRAVDSLRAALAEPEQEPVAWYYERGTDKGISFAPDRDPYKDWQALYPAPPEAVEPIAWMVYTEGGASAYVTDNPNDLIGAYRALPLYTAPTPQREHITDGSPCWCNPDVFEEDGGNVIVHNYDDNWQQYAKPGETAQQCIERHRAEQDALMKLYATPRKPLTDEMVKRMKEVCTSMEMRGAFADGWLSAEAAHGIGEQT